MKTALLLLVVLLTAACATKDGFVDHTSHQCTPGDPVSIEAGVEAEDLDYADPAMISQRLTVRVRVSNLTDGEIEVTSIRTEQSNESASYRIENGYGKFEQAIPEGEDHVFEIPSTGRRVNTTRDAVTSRQVVLTVIVGLANGDVYRCRFSV